MKKTNRILFLFLTTIATVFISCTVEVEPLGSSSVEETPIENPGTNPVTPSGDYWPMAVNNTWTYKNNGATQPPMKITATEQISGKTYYKYSNFIGTTTVQGSEFNGNIWTRKENNTYFLRQDATIPAQNGNPAITVLPVEIQILKDNLAVNQTWTHTFTQTMMLGNIPIDSEVEIIGTVLEKDIELTVNGVAFSDVIKVKVIQNTQGVSQSNFYWFAKNVGLIKFQSDLGTTATNYEIISYNLN